MNALIQAENLVRHYGSHCAVRDVTFSVETGEVVGFLGPNGAGKSTTLNMISGNLAPDSGRILINGIEIGNEPRRAKHFLGYLPDTPPVHGDSTVDEFLGFCARIHRVPGSLVKQCVESAKQLCGLSDVGNRLVSNLSKGFQQRVGVAQAILHDPPLIILDEPMVGLDPIQIREMRELIRNLGKNHGIILSSHLLSEVRSTCTRTLIIHQGRVILDTDMTGLEQSLGNSNLLLKTRCEVDLSHLMIIPGVHSVEVLTATDYRIRFGKGYDPAEEISETVVRSGWGLRELRSETRTIEELFIQLTESPPAIKNTMES